MNKTQVLRDIKKRLADFNLDTSVINSTDEAKTRLYLIEPFFELLGYNRGYEDGELIPEYTADFGNQKGQKVDYAITFRGKPQIIIEAKKANIRNLKANYIKQLNEYFNYLDDAKIGILTDGIQYHFYCRYQGKGLNSEPFLSFDLNNIDGDVDELADLHLSQIDIKKVLEKAEESYFLDNFQEGLYQELKNPSRELIKSIYQNMGGNRLTESLEKNIKELINIISLKAAVDRLQREGAAGANSGIHTTTEELQVYQIIRTILAQKRNIDTDKISFKDQRTKFSVLYDGSIRKNICDLIIEGEKRVIIINGEKHEIPDLDSILKLKKLIIESALHYTEL